jgi:hypothetical protein
MHIHLSGMNQNTSYLNSVAAAEKSAQAKRAADVRKKLAGSAQETNGVAGPEEGLLIGRWMDSRPGPAIGEDQYSNPGGRDPDFG